MKVREVLKLIKKDGWYQVRQKGSHRHFKHTTQRGTVTVPGHPSDTLKPKTERDILRQAGLR